jgi:hypothetical protein
MKEEEKLSMIHRVLVLSLVAFLMPACGDSHDAAAEDTIDVLEEMAAAMQGISSADDAAAAVKTLEGLGEKMVAIQKRAKALGKTTPEQAEELAEKFGQRGIDAMKQIQMALMNLEQYPEVNTAFTAATSGAVKSGAK